MQLAKQHRPGKTVPACLWGSGAFNICYRVRYDEGPDIIIRFAALGRAILRREKEYFDTCSEVFGHGICWACPYIIMSFLEGVPLSLLLKDPSAGGRPVLNPQISDQSLKRAYREMAAVIVELSRYEFDSIVRPLTLNMNELMVSANLPEEAFPSHTFKSSTEYFEALAMQHLSHLRLQQRDAVSNEEDCRKKFTARCLFLDITRKLSTEHPQGPFRLYCDDFRPSNVLIELDPFRVSGVIDWEFTYAAPAEMRWPKDWEGDLDLFLAHYLPRLCLFLKRLSPRIEDSMKTGLFFTSLDDRIELLNPEEKQEMAELVDLKTGQLCYPGH
ncbi:hypothetical protein P168DRAFT_298113 [Aspergillus campestris IBT 28561]|uniref:Aminoglycoside phosphotransferase domain-containing protein n=1 Tax=Aspergillus campestris (strain IBT 28561) TaxID=1392248 RepID=A0A2I1D0C6_ASPC2|nr:uncharacterized protein P168DRAFT_298113 [Aspergillus campestris IBT 28561]PKY03326.1 hypothetical protein P168DRAFT_298113 [Aspergillus campestris IBT 28561]